MIQFDRFAPDALDPSVLVLEARGEGFRFLDRMLSKIEEGDRPFTDKRELFLGAWQGSELVAVGGVSLDPYDAPASTGRLRHLYVRKAWRARGLGKELVMRLIQHSTEYFKLLRLRTDTDAASAFYEAIGFQRIDEDHATHVLHLLR